MYTFQYNQIEEDLSQKGWVAVVQRPKTSLCSFAAITNLLHQMNRQVGFLIFDPQCIKKKIEFDLVGGFEQPPQDAYTYFMNEWLEPLQAWCAYNNCPIKSLTNVAQVCRPVFKKYLKVLGYDKQWKVAQLIDIKSAYILQNYIKNGKQYRLLGGVALAKVQSQANPQEVYAHFVSFRSQTDSTKVTFFDQLLLNRQIQERKDHMIFNQYRYGQFFDSDTGFSVPVELSELMTNNMEGSISNVNVLVQKNRLKQIQMFTFNTEKSSIPIEWIQHYNNKDRVYKENSMLFYFLEIKIVRKNTSGFAKTSLLRADELKDFQSDDGIYELFDTNGDKCGLSTLHTLCKIVDRPIQFINPSMSQWRVKIWELKAQQGNEVQLFKKIKQS